MLFKINSQILFKMMKWNFKKKKNQIILVFKTHNTLLGVFKQSTIYFYYNLDYFPNIWMSLKDLHGFCKTIVSKNTAFL